MNKDYLAERTFAIRSATCTIFFSYTVKNFIYIFRTFYLVPIFFFAEFNIIKINDTLIVTAAIIRYALAVYKT